MVVGSGPVAVKKNAFKIMTLSNIAVLICRFKDHNRLFYSLSMIREMCFLPKYDS